MRGAILYAPRDIRFVERADPTIVEPTDAIIRIAAACVCGSDLWPYRGIEPINEPRPMGHEYCGIVEEVGSAVRHIKPLDAVRTVILPRRSATTPITCCSGMFGNVPACPSAIAA